MTQLAQQLQATNQMPQPAGPTKLYLNFDGWTNSPQGTIGAFQGSPQDREDIRYRTAELFAPFDVEVLPIGGNGHVATDPGSTTVFVGPNGKGGFTPIPSTDYPRAINPNGGTNHILNSDATDIAFVDPALPGPATSPNANLAVSLAIAHEAGHTFGLAHVRTDGTADFPTNPTDVPVYSSTLPPDIMSYDSNDDFFSNNEFNVTAANFVPGQGTHNDPSRFPVFQGHNILTQNSFSYLQAVLGAHPAAGQVGVVDENVLVLSGPGLKLLNVVDPGFYQQSAVGQHTQPLPLAAGSAVSGALARPGDYAAYQLNLGATWVPGQILSVTPTAGAHLVLMVYDETNGVSAGNLTAFTRSSVPLTFVPQAGHVYDLVVGGENGQNVGAYSFTIGPVRTNLQGATFTLRDAGQVQRGTLTIGAQNGDTFTGTFTPNDATQTPLSVGGRVGGLVNGSSVFNFSGTVQTIQATHNKVQLKTVETDRTVGFSGQVAQVAGSIALPIRYTLTGQGSYSVTVTTEVDDLLHDTSTSSTQTKELLTFVSGLGQGATPVLVNAVFAAAPAPAPAKVVSPAASPVTFLSAPTDSAGLGVQPVDLLSVNVRASPTVSTSANLLAPAGKVLPDSVLAQLFGDQPGKADAATL
jgi:hypothetical protein